MKKLITIFKKENIENLAKYVDGFVIGSNDFSTRLTNSFSVTEINEIAKLVQSLNKEIFLNVNQMFTDKQLEEFETIIKSIDTNNLTGIIVADIGTFVLLEKLNLGNKVIYNPETLLTNITDFNYLSSNNIFGAYVSKEITVEDIKLIGAKKKYNLFLVGHGHLNMFYSKRHLLDNYQELINKEESYSNLQNLKIIEPKREDTPFPIYQDKAGTHVFRSKVMNSLDFYQELSEVVDYFIIDTIFKDDNYGLMVSKLYTDLDSKNIPSIQALFNEKWDNGFLDNKTYYKRKS